MTDLKTRRLIKLGDTDLTVASPDEDIRGRSVIDSAGKKIGEVSALIIDDTEARVRFMQVATGGFLGIGDKHFLIPVDAITSIDKDNVYIYVSGYSAVRSAKELPGCMAAPAGDSTSAQFRIEVIRVPLDHPEQAKVVNSPHLLADLSGRTVHAPPPSPSRTIPLEFPYEPRPGRSDRPRQPSRHPRRARGHRP